MDFNGSARAHTLRTVLLVEPDDLVRQMCALVLRTGGYKVTLLDTLKDAVRVLGETRFDVVIASEDLCDDLRLAGIVKQLRAVSAAPIVLTVGLAVGGGDCATANTTDGVRILKKPFGMRELLDLVGGDLRVRQA